MSEQAEVKPDSLPDLDDLLQCPVCYEIPPGHIFQCDQGHHVCGRCKMRLEQCPVCRALFFGTRNYAMEELIANVKKLRAFKLGGKITTDIPSENNTPAKEDTPTVAVNESDNDDASDVQSNQSVVLRAPLACKGLFRCLSCKNGNGVRLPAARLLNHLRYFHSPELIEGKSENGEYLQAWQFSTVPGRIVTAVRVADMGIFFLIIEMSNNTVCAWLSMAASPWVAHEYCYTVTVSGNDREAIFSDCVWSVRSCEGSLKKRGHCLSVNGLDARALTAPSSISCKLAVRRAPADQLAQQTQPRAVLRVADRASAAVAGRAQPAHDLEPFLQDLQNDVARLSRAFATLGREANALVRSEAEMRSRIENRHTGSNDRTDASAETESQPATQNNRHDNTEHTAMSRNARKRMRQRLRAALDATQPPEPGRPVAVAPARQASVALGRQASVALGRQASAAPGRQAAAAPGRQASAAPGRQASAAPGRQASAAPHVLHFVSGLAVVQSAPPVAPPAPAGPSDGLPQDGNQTRANKKKRRQRR